MSDISPSPTHILAEALIRRRSVTPDDAGCQELLGKRLRALGFRLEPMAFGAVENLWARLGDQGPLLVFAGHTDVVASGPESTWSSPPYAPEVRDGYLYGRGAADMKSSLAAMLTAVERLLASGTALHGSLAFLLTSDEEGVAIDGTRRVVEALQARDERIDYCVVGEPSSTSTVGDTVKVGRRGSLGCVLTVHGIQGHVAYPHLARNPVHDALGALHVLSTTVWDEGYEAFAPTGFQISNIRAGTGATNVIPGSLEVVFNFRFSPASSATSLQERVEAILQAHGVQYDADWRLSGEPFLTPRGALVDATVAAIEAETDRTPELSTGGGTSDARFIAPTGAQVLELGPVNATIHQVDECVKLADLEILSRMYENIARHLLTRP